MNEWFQIARTPQVVRRGLLYSVVVGSLLVSINHGDAIAQGDVPFDRLWRICLTMVVPYLVSTFSSVGAMREARNASKKTA